MRGPRLEALVGTDIIVPWRENICYSIKKNGDHGGATQQEMLVPVGIWTAGAALSDEYLPDLHPPPDWWTGNPPQLEESVQAVSDGQSSSLQDDLFRAPRKARWIEDLLDSEVLRAQRARVGRLVLEDVRLRALLNCLSKHGDRATTERLAAAINQPMLRIRGVLTMLQRMLNIHGFPTIKIESSTNMVLLNYRLLRTQFEL